MTEYRSRWEGFFTCDSPARCAGGARLTILPAAQRARLPDRTRSTGAPATRRPRGGAL